MKRYLLGILALFLMLFGLVAPARAWSPKELWDTVTCPADIDCTVRAAAVASQNFLFKAGVGKDFEELTAADLSKMANGNWNTGLISGVSEIGKLAYSSPPVPRFADYVRYELSDNLLNTPSYAAFGEIALNPVVDFWRGMRDISYALFMVVMVVIGFMIILRREISPRVVVTFTNALPRIVTGLVLITFSFPLIALAVDVGIVFGSRLVSDVVSQASKNITIEEVPAPPAADAEEVGVAPFVSTTLPKIIGGFLLGVQETVAEPLTGLILGVIFFIGAIIIFGLAIFKLLISYAWLLIYAIFSPLLILFGSLPGQEGTITDLGKNVLAKVLAFPATLFFLILGWYMSTTTTVTPPDFGSEVGQFGDIIGRAFILRANVLLALLALVMLFAAYKAPSLIEEGLGAGGKKPRKK